MMPISHRSIYIFIPLANKTTVILKVHSFQGYQSKSSKNSVLIYVLWDFITIYLNNIKKPWIF